MKRNVPIIGFVIGAILPFVGLAIMYFLWFGKGHFSIFRDTLLHDPTDAFKVYSLSLLINLAPFVYYTNKRLDLTARGIFVATMLYVVIIVLMRYVWN